MIGGLSLIGGFLETYTYCTRGKVFANAQTGNLLKIVLILTNEKDGTLWPCLFSLGMFGYGTYFAHLHKSKNRKILLLILEIALFLLIGMISEQGNAPLINGSVSWICAVQSEWFDQMPTTVCTGNVRKIFKGQNRKESLLSICMFLCGAIFGIIAIRYLAHYAIWLLIPILLDLLIKERRGAF